MDSTTLESSCKVQQILMSQDNVLVFTTIIVMLFMLATYVSASLFLSALRDQQAITLMVARTALMCMTVLASEGNPRNAAKTGFDEKTLTKTPSVETPSVETPATSPYDETDLP